MQQKDLYKRDRVKSVLPKYLAEVITKDLKNPLLSLCSINEVKYIDELRFARVYVSHLDKNRSVEAVNVLNKQASRIRSLLSSKLAIYRVPSLEFVLDTSFDDGKKIDDIIKSMHDDSKTSLTLDDLPDKKAE